MRSAMGVGALWSAVTLLNFAWVPRFHAPEVPVEKLQSAPLDLMVRAPGLLEAEKYRTERAAFDGAVESKQFEAGQAVKKGQLLLVVNRDQIRMEYENRLGDLRGAQSELARARKEVRLQRSLFEQQAVPYSAVEEAQRVYARARDQVRSAESAFDLEKKRWGKNRYTAAFNGTITEDFLKSDSQVFSQKEIFTLSDLTDFHAVAQVEELDIAAIQPGQPAEIRLPALEGRNLKAVVDRIASRSGDAQTSDIPVMLRLTDPPDAALRPRLSADIRIATGRTEPVLSVPVSAIDNRGGRPKVWRISLTRRLTACDIKIGRASPDRVEVLEGLSEGDRIVARTGPALVERMKVRISREGGAAGLAWTQVREAFASRWRALKKRLSR